RVPASTTPAPSEPPAAHEATALAADLREALRPLWRQLNAHRTLSMGKVGILSRLDRRGAMTATDLAALERISHQAVANAVRELEEMGLVSRSPDPDDRRRALVTLTHAGRDRLAAELDAGQDCLTHPVATELNDAELSYLRHLSRVLLLRLLRLQLLSRPPSLSRRSFHYLPHLASSAPELLFAFARDLLARSSRLTPLVPVLVASSIIRHAVPSPWF